VGLSRGNTEAGLPARCGPLAPWTEASEGYDLEVVGEILEDLAGALFRTSSDPRFQPRSTDRYHW
jgi:carotenoid cleavage dioxygenase